MQPEETLIVGAGPAGIAAAIQLQRSRVPFTLLEKNRVGGLLWNANLVENYPGFPNGISGPRLAGLFEKHMHRTGVQVTFNQVSLIDLIGDDIFVSTGQKHYQPRYLIIATGTKPRPFPITIPEGVRDKIFSEVYPLLGMRDQQIVIVGAGDAAFDYALNLGKANIVTILHRGDQMSCLPLLWERAAVSKQIIFQDRTEINQVEAGSRGNNLLITGKHQNAPFEIECDYLIYAIGREPQADLLSSNLLAGQKKLAHSGRIHMVGDLANGYLRQTAIATGGGLRAAMKIHAEIIKTEALNQ